MSLLGSCAGLSLVGLIESWKKSESPWRLIRIWERAQYFFLLEILSVQETSEFSKDEAFYAKFARSWWFDSFESKQRKPCKCQRKPKTSVTTYSDFMPFCVVACFSPGTKGLSCRKLACFLARDKGTLFAARQQSNWKSSTFSRQLQQSSSRLGKWPACGTGCWGVNYGFQSGCREHLMKTNIRQETSSYYSCCHNWHDLMFIYIHIKAARNLLQTYTHVWTHGSSLTAMNSPSNGLGTAVAGGTWEMLSMHQVRVWSQRSFTQNKWQKLTWQSENLSCPEYFSTIKSESELQVKKLRSSLTDYLESLRGCELVLSSEPLW